MRKLLPCLAGLALLGACTTTDTTSEQSAAAVSAELSNYERAMGTVSALERAGNEQTAIDRLTQLLGDPALTPEQTAETLQARARLRYGTGNDVDGAIEDAEEILATYPESDAAAEVTALLQEAEATRAELEAELAGDITPMQRFETLFRLGRHQEASDIMMASALQPDNAYVLDMYQIGYLCDGADLAGPSYALVEPDGTERTVQFCNLTS